jgi:hypothetical protein
MARDYAISRVNQNRRVIDGEKPHQNRRADGASAPVLSASPIREDAVGKLYTRL